MNHGVHGAASVIDGDSGGGDDGKVNCIMEHGESNAFINSGKKYKNSVDKIEQRRTQ